MHIKNYIYINGRNVFFSLLLFNKFYKIVYILIKRTVSNVWKVFFPSIVFGTLVYRILGSVLIYVIV